MLGLKVILFTAVLMIASLYVHFKGHHATIYRVQTVDFNILHHTLPPLISYLVEASDIPGIQRLLKVNYGLFTIVVTDPSGTKIIASNRDVDVNKLKDVGDYYDRVLFPPDISSAQFSYLAPYSKEYVKNDSISQPLSSERRHVANVYYLRTQSFTFWEDFYYYLNPGYFLEPNHSKTAPLIALVSIVIGLLIYVWLNMRTKYYRVAAENLSNQIKLNERELQDKNAQLQRMKDGLGNNAEQQASLNHELAALQPKIDELKRVVSKNAEHENERLREENTKLKAYEDDWIRINSLKEQLERENRKMKTDYEEIMQESDAQTKEMQQLQERQVRYEVMGGGRNDTGLMFDRILQASKRINSYTLNTGEISVNLAQHHGADDLKKYSNLIQRHSVQSKKYITSIISSEFERAPGIRIGADLDQTIKTGIVIICGIGKERRYTLKLFTVFQTKWQAYMLSHLLQSEVPILSNTTIKLN